jgi:hypothetical protein
MGLPFTQSVPLQELGGEEVREVRISPLWPGGDPAVTDVGARYDFTAQAELDAVDELQGSNRQIEHDGVVYKIVSAAEHEFLPHVELRLWRVRGG